MKSLQLIPPTLSLEKEFLEMLEEWKATKEDLIPWTSKLYQGDFRAYVNSLHEQSKGKNLPEGYVRHSTFWLVNENQKILGSSNLRHYLTPDLLVIGGHIGYGITPSERRKGNATKILELTLLEAKKLGIEKVLLSCHQSNIGSSKTMLKNGGKFWKEALIDGRMIEYYWIEV